MRQKFLHQHWNSYPAMPNTPQGNFVGARLISIQNDELICEQGFRFFFSEQTKILPLKAPTPLKFQWNQILQAGDVLAILPDENSHLPIKEVWLLAPSQVAYGPRLHAPPRQSLIYFSDFLDQIRQFFKAQDFLEANTPSLVPCPGTETHLDIFCSELTLGKKSRKLYLPTSPELHLKKMLAIGYGPLFEIKNCFRNGEISAHHEPEFIMLEWYRPFNNLQRIADDAEKFLRFLSANEKLKIHNTSMKNLFHEYLQFDLQPQTSAAELLSLAKNHDLRVVEGEPFDDLFNRIFIEWIEPKLKLKSEFPILVKDFPPALAAYARLTDEGWADRFEIYWYGIELANAFHELNDPDVQLQRMKFDLAKKKKLGKPSVELDEDFLQALRFGLPPCAGIAVGVERLFMVLQGLQKIQDIKVFPYSRQI